MNKAIVIAHMKEELKNFSKNSNYVGYINKLTEQQSKDILYNINSVMMNLGNRISNGHEISIHTEFDRNAEQTEFVLIDNEMGKEIKRSTNLLDLLFLAEL